MFTVYLLACLPAFSDSSPPPLARAGCTGAVSTSYFYAASSGCMGAAVRRAPARTVAANVKNRTASRQVARQSRARVEVYTTRAAAVRVTVAKPRVYVVKP